MDHKEFDQTIREMTITGTSRRTIFKKIAVAAVTGVAGAAVLTNVATDEVDAKGKRSNRGRGRTKKFEVCHCEGQGQSKNCKTLELGSRKAVAKHVKNHEADYAGPCIVTDPDPDPDPKNFCDTREGKACECGCDREAGKCSKCPDPGVCPTNPCLTNEDCAITKPSLTNGGGYPVCECVGAVVDNSAEYPAPPVYGVCEEKCVVETCEAHGFECGSFESCGQTVECTCPVEGNICVEHKCVEPCKDADVKCYSDTDCCEGNVCDTYAHTCGTPAA